MKLTIEKVLKAIEGVPDDTPVRFDVLNICWNGKLDSWRGIYAELALGWTTDLDKVGNVGQLREKLTKAIGSTFQGYKGGDYQMNAFTPLNPDNYGEWTDTEFCGLDVDRSMDGKTYWVTFQVRGG